jgi:hypothetical protein
MNHYVSTTKQPLEHDPPPEETEYFRLDGVWVGHTLWLLLESSLSAVAAQSI